MSKIPNAVEIIGSNIDVGSIKGCSGIPGGNKKTG